MRSKVFHNNTFFALFAVLTLHSCKMKSWVNLLIPQYVSRSCNQTVLVIVFFHHHKFIFLKSHSSRNVLDEVTIVNFILDFWVSNFLIFWVTKWEIYKNTFAACQGTVVTSRKRTYVIGLWAEIATFFSWNTILLERTADSFTNCICVWDWIFFIYLKQTECRSGYENWPLFY